jgi:invasion protein IalB
MRFAALLLVGLLAPSVLAAQTPSPPERPTNPPASPAAPGAPSGTGQQFGSWVLGCPATADQGAPCVLVQEVSETLSRKVVFVWLVQYDKSGSLLGAFRLPTGVFVDRGLVMKMDDKAEGLKVNYTRCDPGECQAVFTISDNLIKQLSAAKIVRVEIALTNGRTANVQLDMNGFPAALAALKARSAAAK